ncbi:MAG: FAD-binding protein [Pseudomonadota bacterium]|nr:FAD-binding protein [Pseudomonadota bacterium]
MSADIRRDILIVGAGAAGMYAAISAARTGASVLLVDKSIVGRGGATVMAQMTVAAAIGAQTDDHWSVHLEDTLESGRDLCDPTLARILCEEAPKRIREMDTWKVGWAREDGLIRQVMAPGHREPRCVYVDFLNTGPAVSGTLRKQVIHTSGVDRLSGVTIIELKHQDRRVCGAIGIEIDTGRRISIAAKSVILAAGGLTRLFDRNSASLNMGGDAYALALHAGADLIDMEFVQFFPIGHLAPRLVGMDPIMWDPFRYKLGGRLLNGQREEFIENYGLSDSGTYSAPRDAASFAILREVASGRGSPAGGAYLSFEHIPEKQLRSAFGPVIDRLKKNGIDLCNAPVEVAPIAHYHMGGIRVDEHMQTNIKGLYAAGEAVGGANGANRLSGNAISEAFVFGERAGRFAAHYRNGDFLWRDEWSNEQAANGHDRRDPANPATLGGVLTELQKLLWKDVGLLRNGTALTKALNRIRHLRDEVAQLYVPAGEEYIPCLREWHDLSASLLVAETIALGALTRTESRGAHQRSDHENIDPQQAHHLVIGLEDRSPRITGTIAVQ